MSLSHDGWGTLTVGNQPTIFDDAGISGDYEFGFDTYLDDVTDSSMQVIKYKGDWENVYAGVAYALKDNGNNNLNGPSHTVDANVGVRIAGLDAAVYYSFGKTPGNDEVTSYILPR